MYSLLTAVLQEEMAMAAASRRMSVAPVNRAASNIRNMSGRHGSMFYGRSTFMEGMACLHRSSRSHESTADIFRHGMITNVF